MAERETSPPDFLGRTSRTPPDAEGTAADAWLLRDEQIRALVDAAPVAVVAAGPDGRIRMVNQKTEEIFGYGRYELVGQPVETLLPESARERHAHHKAGYFEHPFARPMGLGADLTARRKDGNDFPIEANLSFIESAGNTVAIAFITGISERKKAKEALQDREAKFRALAETMPVAAIVLEGTRIVYANPAGAELSGYSQQELLGMNLRQIVHPDYLDHVEQRALARLRGEDGPPHYEAKFVIKGGEERWGDIRAGLIEFEGKPAVLATISDTTDRRQAEEALRDREGKFRTFAEAMTAAAVIVKGTEIIYANRAANKLAGYTHPALTGTSLRDLIHPDYAEAVAEQALACLRGERVPSRMEAKIVTNGGEMKWADIDAALIEFDGSPAILATVLDITERKATEEALRESEEHYRLLAEQAQDMIFRYRMTEPAGYEYVSPASLEIGGYTPDEFYADPELGHKIIHPDDLQEFERMIAGSATEPVPLRWRRKDGSIIWTEQRNTRLYDDNGGLVAIEGIVRDISDRKQAEEALHESEERYKSLLEGLSDGVSVLDREWRYVVVNDAAERFVRMPKKTLLGGKLTDLFPGVEQTPFFHTLERVMETRRPDIVADEYTFADGRKGWCEVRVYAVPEGILCISGDITERRQAEEALRLQSEIMRNMAEAMYLIRASDGIIVYTNPAFERLFGYGPDEMIGRHVSVVNAPTDKSPEETAREIIAALDSSGEWRGDILNIKKDGTPFWCYANVSTFDHPEHGKVWVTYHADITDRKRAEQALRDSEERFRSTLDGMLEGCQIIGPGFRYLYVNDAVAEHGHRTKEELLGRTMMEMYPGIEETEAFARIKRCMEERVPHRMENEFTYPDGARGWFELSIQPAPEGVFVLSLDITERRLIERDLHEAREELEAKVEQRMEAGATYRLTFRELTVLHLVAEGKADKEIAQELGIKPLTAQKHVANILAKMEASSRTEAGVRAVREGLLDDTAPSPSA